MKKGIALIELVVSITISSFLLIVIVSLMVFCTSILDKQEENKNQYEDLVNVELYIKSYIDKSKTIDVTDDKILITDLVEIQFDKTKNELISNDKVVYKTKTINNIVFIKTNLLIIVEFHVQKKGTNENVIYKYSYFNL